MQIYKLEDLFLFAEFLPFSDFPASVILSSGFFFFTLFFPPLPVRKCVFHNFSRMSSPLSPRGRGGSGFVGPEAYTVWEWSSLRKRIENF